MMWQWVGRQASSCNGVDKRTEPCWGESSCASLEAAYISMSLMGMLFPRKSPVPAVLSILQCTIMAEIMSHNTYIGRRSEKRLFWWYNALSSMSTSISMQSGKVNTLYCGWDTVVQGQQSQRYLWVGLWKALWPHAARSGDPTLPALHQSPLLHSRPACKAALHTRHLCPCTHPPGTTMSIKIHPYIQNPTSSIGP